MIRPMVNQAMSSMSPLMSMMALQKQQQQPAAAPAAAPANKGMMGKLDPMTWLMISGALAQGAQPGGGGFGGAMPGIARALEGQQERRDEDKRSAAQQRALALMQAGDMKGAIAVLGSAKGLEGSALNMAGQMEGREYEEGREREIYDRERGDYLDDVADGRAHDDKTWRERYDVTRGDQVEDRNFDARVRRETARAERPDWEKVTAADGSVYWVQPGTNISVDSGLDAPGAQTRSLLGAETTGRAVAGIPGAKEANARLARMEAGGVDAEGNQVAPYNPGKDGLARFIDSMPLPGFNALAATAGGEDFQSYKQGFAQFESAMMPIMSGAAVTESEAARLMNAVKPLYGDNSQTLAAKSAQRARMVDALDLALRGDREALNEMLEANYETPAASPDGGRQFSQTAVNPQTGERIGKDPETGRWVVIQ